MTTVSPIHHSKPHLKAMVKTALKKMLTALGLPASGFLPNWQRMQLAKRHLKGVGLEIGAMHNPLRVPKSARVEYLDVTPREENIRKFPELNPNDLVQVDHLANGFLMNGIASSSFDFVIANHVLEHASNPVGALVQWFRVLKPGGILYCALPRIDITFDKDRKLTRPQHMLEDYFLCAQQKTVEMRARNLDHYQEWLTIAIPTHTGLPPPPPEQLERQVRDYSAREEEIHFHTFTMETALDFLHLVAKEVIPDIHVVEAINARAEILLILQKRCASTPPVTHSPTP